MHEVTQKVLLTSNVSCWWWIFPHKKKDLQ